MMGHLSALQFIECSFFLTDPYKKLLNPAVRHLRACARCFLEYAAIITTDEFSPDHPNDEDILLLALLELDASRRDNITLNKSGLDQEDAKRMLKVIAHVRYCTCCKERVRRWVPPKKTLELLNFLTERFFRIRRGEKLN